MKINEEILSIPPYISTSWKNINSIFLDSDNNLIILLHTKEKISIPNLEKQIIDIIFDAHAKYLETQNKTKQKIGFSIPMPLDIESMESMPSIMQHNPNQKDAPDLPPEILKKIIAISKIIGIEDPHSSPKAHPNCNCFHCQIARAISGEDKKTLIEEDEVKDEDLKFREWDIKQSGKKLYTVINPLDKNEHYSVFLGNPIGCTCGKKNCEHLKAVLNS